MTRSAVLALVLVSGLATSSLLFARNPAPKQENPGNNSGSNAGNSAGNGAATGEMAKPDSAPPMPTPPPPAMPMGIPVPNLPIAQTQTLDGGLVVEDMKIGAGPEIKPDDLVTIFYQGTIKSSGEEFDSAYRRATPLKLALNQVIEGWKKGVPGMRGGGIRRLTIPAAMAYGDHPPQGAAIKPGDDLVFVITAVEPPTFKDTVVGTGDPITGPAVLATRYSIKDQSGKEIEKSADGQMYIWLPGEFDAIYQGMEGMRVGGKRTVSIPASSNYFPQGASTREMQVPLTCEVELIGLRNLPQQRGR
ncbi:hypothetical protein BH11PLA1_BH11PLA1_17430 [soil metagenome]